MLGRVERPSVRTDGEFAASAPSHVPDAMPLPVDNSPSTRRRRVPRWLRGCGRVLGKTTTVVLPLLLLAVGLVYLKLYHSPISLSFIVDPIQRVLNEEMPGVQIQVEDAILQRTSSGGVELRLTSVRVTEDSGSIVALASRASVQLSFSALRKGRIVPSRIDLLQPRVVWFGSDRSSYMLGYGRDLQGRTLSMPPAYAEGTVPPRETEVAKTVTIVEGRIDAVRRLTEMATEMRRRKGAASFLETFGLKDASFIVSDDGQQTVLRVPTLELSMRHSSWRSIISGSGTIASDDSRPFSFKFRTEDSERQDRLTMTVDVEDFVPRSFALGSLTPKGLLSESIDLPIAGNGRIELSRQGDVLGGTFDVALGTGQLHLPWLGKVPLDLSGGQIKASYAGDGKRLTIEPSTIRWRSSHATLKGMVEPATGSDGAAGWRFEAEGIDGRLTAEDLGASPLPLSSLVMRGVAFPQTGFAEISEFRMAADKATVAMSGTIAATGQSRVARLDGKIGPMSLDALKTMWPQALAPLTRTWVAQHVVTGRLKGGSFSITNKRDQTDARDLMSTGHREVALTLDAQQLGVEYLKGLPPIEAPEARLTVDGSIVVLHMPTATVRATPTQQLQMQDGSLTVTGVGTDHPQGRIDAQVTGPAAALLDLADRPPLGFLRNAGIDATGFDGKLDARFAVAFPMRPEGTIKDVQIIDMKANVVEGQGRKLMGRYSISGASIRAEARDNTIDVTGEALLEGVLAKIGWRHVIGGAPTDQQNLRIRATLGSSERAQLGIHVGDMLSGDMVVDLTVRPGDDGPGVRAAIDLTGAELAIPEIAWTKPPGQRAELRFDLGKRRDGNVLLQNFRLDGDTIGVNGWVALGPDNRPIEYMFPDFSLNTVSNLNVRGTLRADRIWDVKATGARFDARDVFRGFLTVASHKQQQNGNQHHSLGIDLDARVDTISGVPDTTSTTASDPLLRGVHLRLSRRGPDLQDVQFSGRHDNGRTLKATLKATPNAPRILVVEAADAGEALTLIGIYRNMQGGEGKLEINLDGAGAAARRGVMTVRRFHVIGDQVVSDVVDAYDVGQPAIQNSPSRPRRVVREQIEFDRMRTAFATGHGQLVIEDMEVTGPILSATIRGTLDYRSRQVQLGGTYTPLSGLNRALSSVPLFGEVFTGPRKEGVVAMTFAIQGPMANPQVIPNPLSLVAPGFLREIFQMAPQNPTITPSRAPQVRPPPQPQTTASQPATGPSPPPPEPTKEKAPARPRAKSKPVAPAVSDGWAATTDPRAKPAERN